MNEIESIEPAEYAMVISERLEVGINRDETAPEPPREPGSAGRDHRGRWVRGCLPGPGRPPAACEETYREALRAVATPEDLGIVFEKIMERARAGDVSAARLVMQHLVGAPGSPQSPHVLEEPDPWTRWRIIEPIIAALVREIPLARLVEVMRAHAGLFSREPGPGSPERAALIATILGALPEPERTGFARALSAPK